MKRVLFKRLLVVMSLVFSGPLLAGDLVDYSESKLRTAQENGESVILAFHSASCGTCKRQKPILNMLLKEDHLAGISALRVDFDNDSELKKKFKVTSPATIVVLKGGKEVARSIGLTSEESLRNLLQKGA